MDCVRTVLKLLWQLILSLAFPERPILIFRLLWTCSIKVRYHSSFSFKYSDRPHTRSAEFADKVPEEVKSQRLAIFQKRQDEISLERNSELLNTTLEVMVELCSENSIKARTGGNHVVHINEPLTGINPGDLLQARIIHAGNHSLRAVLA